MKFDPSHFEGKNIAILGFGVEGKSAANYLLNQQASVTIFDKEPKDTFPAQEIKKFEDKGVTFELQELAELETFDVIVRSPGISLNIPELQGVPTEKVTSVTKLFFDLCPCPIIGVTGTKGKGTTATLIYEMLKAKGEDVYLGGNIGTPALDFLEDLSLQSTVILELSSFQLVDLHKSPQVAVILMITSEHLDYHKDITEYVESKRNLIKFQTSENITILNHDYPASNESDIYTDGKVYYISREGEVDQGCFVRGNSIVVRDSGKETEVVTINDIALPGRHNLENVCAAVMVATTSGVSKQDIVQVLKNFKGLEHRLELVRTVKGVRYYDDSFSTTPETAAAAIESFEDPEIIILGGSSKNSDFSRLGELIGKTENIKAIIGIGSEWPEIKKHINDWHFQIIEGLESMSEVVSKAASIAETGDVVLLSPACASFGMFKNYKDRGNQFKDAVNSL